MSPSQPHMSDDPHTHYRHTVDLRRSVESTDEGGRDGPHSHRNESGSGGECAGWSVTILLDVTGRRSDTSPSLSS